MSPIAARICGSLTTTKAQGSELRPEGAHRPASRMASTCWSVTGSEVKLRTLRRSRIAVRVGLSIRWGSLATGALQIDRVASRVGISEVGDFIG